jgi:transposase-like protein
MGVVMKRSYSDEERGNALAALAANGGNVNKTARQLGIPLRTLWNWATGACHPEAAEIGQRKKGPLADVFEGIVWQLLGSITPEKMAAATLQQLATAAGIAVDKMQLLRGKPTGVTETRTPEQLDAEIRRLGAELGYFEPKAN